MKCKQKLVQFPLYQIISEINYFNSILLVYITKDFRFFPPSKRKQYHQSITEVAEC